MEIDGPCKLFFEPSQGYYSVTVARVLFNLGIGKNYSAKLYVSIQFFAMKHPHRAIREMRYNKRVRN